MLAAGIEIICHVVEGADELGHFAGGDERDGMFVFACRDSSSMASARASTGRVICLKGRVPARRWRRRRRR